MIAYLDMEENFVRNVLLELTALIILKMNVYNAPALSKQTMKSQFLVLDLPTIADVLMMSQKLLAFLRFA